jgi:hypothetical protein
MGESKALFPRCCSSCENKEYDNVLCAIVCNLLNMKHKLEFFLFNRLKTAFLRRISDIIPDRMPDNDVIIGLAT